MFKKIRKKKVVTETLRSKGINLTLEGFKVNKLNKVLVTCGDLYVVCSHLLFDYLIPEFMLFTVYTNP